MRYTILAAPSPRYCNSAFSCRIGIVCSVILGYESGEMIEFGFGCEADESDGCWSS